MNIKTDIIQLAKYGFFGVISTLIHLFTAWLIIYFFTKSIFIANTIAFFIAFLFSYIFQTLFVFNVNINTKRLLKFFIVQYSSFLLSYLISNIFYIKNSYLHTLIIVAIIPLITFAIHKFWTFTKE